MKIRKIISYLLAIIFVILIFATILLSMVNAVVFSKSNLKKQLDKVDYYTQINTIIKEASNNYIMQSGFDESIMDNVVEKEKINEDINNVIDSIYNNEELTISTEQIKTKLNKNIEEYIQKNNYKVDNKTQKDIEKFEDKIEDIYANNITYSKSTIKKVAKYFKMAKRMTRAALVAVSILAIILAIIIYKVNKPTFGISLISTGIICIFIKFYSAINVAVNNILVLNKAFSNFAISLINQVIQYVFVSGIVLTVIGILLTILFEKKNTSNEE